MKPILIKTEIYKDNRAYVTSIGSLYSNFTEALDLRRSVDEGKVEALAAYGLPNRNFLKILSLLREEAKHTLYQGIIKNLN